MSHLEAADADAEADVELAGGVHLAAVARRLAVLHGEGAHRPHVAHRLLRHRSRVRHLDTAQRNAG